MQTFLPYPSLKESVQCLDPDRLGNQVYRESLTLIRGGWKHHPASKMWRGFHHSLALYAIYGLDELEDRGFYYPHHRREFESHLKFGPEPPWLGDERLHASHRAALLYKNFQWYSQFGWTEEPKVKYWWPV